MKFKFQNKRPKYKYLKKLLLHTLNFIFYAYNNQIFNGINLYIF